MYVVFYANLKYIIPYNNAAFFSSYNSSPILTVRSFVWGAVACYLTETGMFQHGSYYRILTITLPNAIYQ